MTIRRIPSLVDLSIGSLQERRTIARIKKSMQESAKKIKAGDKVEISRVKKQLIDAGIYTSTGKLRKAYQ